MKLAARFQHKDFKHIHDNLLNIFDCAYNQLKGTNWYIEVIIAIKRAIARIDIMDERQLKVESVGN